MGLENIARCDICKDTAAMDDTADWHRATLAPLTPNVGQPPTGQPPTDVALMGWQPAQTPSVAEAVLCHKPSCLTKWAAAQNKTDKK